MKNGDPPIHFCSYLTKTIPSNQKRHKQKGSTKYQIKNNINFIIDQSSKLAVKKHLLYLSNLVYPCCYLRGVHVQPHHRFVRPKLCLFPLSTLKSKEQCKERHLYIKKAKRWIPIKKIVVCLLVSQDFPNRSIQRRHAVRKRESLYDEWTK